MKYKSVVVTKRGGRDALQIVENELRPPATGEVRIKIQATPVCQDDVAVRVGNRPFLPKLPFVPGYSILGEVDALGDGVSQVAVGDRVAALTQCGGYAEYIYLAPETLVLIALIVAGPEFVILAVREDGSARLGQEGPDQRNRRLPAACPTGEVGVLQRRTAIPRACGRFAEGGFGPHALEARQASAPQKVHQDRFSLVIGSVGHSDAAGLGPPGGVQQKSIAQPAAGGQSPEPAAGD